MQIVGLAVLVVGVIVTLAGVFLTLMQLLRPPRHQIPRRSVGGELGPLKLNLTTYVPWADSGSPWCNIASARGFYVPLK
jgi:hypothetical protein